MNKKNSEKNVIFTTKAPWLNALRASSSSYSTGQAKLTKEEGIVFELLGEQQPKRLPRQRA